jgi:CubicO group peptidase (beta-lactamase class C family)
MDYMKQLLVFSAWLFLLVSASAQTLYFPDTGWLVQSPTAVRMNKALIDSAVQLAQRSENKYDRDLRIALYKSYMNEPDYKILGPTKQRGGPAGLIIKDGYIVAQWGDVERVDMTFSVTKSFLSTMAGLALQEGLIRNVMDKVNRYVWDNNFTGTHNSKITWEHLLNQSSDWSGTLFGVPDWADRPPKEGTIDDWKNRKLNEPGTFYKYNDVRVNLLAYSLLQVWRQPLPVVLKEKIMDPIGASTTWRWYGYDNSYELVDGQMVQSVSGGGHFGGGLFINTLDMARFGLLFLRNGQWKNQKLVSDQWIRAATQPSPTNKNYGYLWWMNTDQQWKDIAPTVFYAAGAGGNYIVVDQQQELLVVVRWMDDSKMGAFMSLVQQALTENKKR